MHSARLFQHFTLTTRRILILVVSILVTGCAPSAQSECTQLHSVQQSPFTLEVINQDTEVVKDAALQTLGAQEQWQQKTAFLAPESEWAGWATQLTVFPKAVTGGYLENPILVPAQELIRGFFLVRNGWNMPHPLRVIFLLDFQQVPVLVGNKLTHFYDLPMMEPQEDKAFEFMLPGLSQGFHQLSILLIADPEDYSIDIEYRFFQQKSFSELRYDLWVGLDSPPQDTLRFESPEIGQSADSRMGNVELVLSAEDPKNNPLLSFSVSPGKQYCVNLRFFNRTPPMDAPYSGPVYLRIAVFWKDKLAQVLDYHLLPDAPENLTLQLAVEPPLEAGNYQFNIVVFTYPGYSQFADLRERTGYPVGEFTRRVVVDVQP